MKKFWEKFLGKIFVKNFWGKFFVKNEIFWEKCGKIEKFRQKAKKMTKNVVIKKIKNFIFLGKIFG